MMLGIVMTVSTFALPPRADQPFMQAALSDLKMAQGFLKKATADKGGHRANAMKLTSDAIGAVNDGISWFRKHKASAGDDSLDVVLPPTDQPNMVEARKFLKSAWDNLDKADADKGGYRAKAMGIITNAIAEVDAGIAFDRNH